MRNISIDMHDLFDSGDPYRRPDEIIKALGITYKRCEGVSHIDVMHFYDCDNIPETLPSYVKAWSPLPNGE